MLYQASFPSYFLSCALQCEIGIWNRAQRLGFGIPCPHQLSSRFLERRKRLKLGLALYFNGLQRTAAVADRTKQGHLFVGVARTSRIKGDAQHRLVSGAVFAL